MNAGRELDALVAERVMGLQIGNDWGAPVYWVEGSDGIRRTQKLPAYSTDIAAAWQVVEKLYDWEFSLKMFEGLASIHYRAEFVSDGNFWSDESIDSPAHAICLAALKAVSK